MAVFIVFLWGVVFLLSSSVGKKDIAPHVMQVPLSPQDVALNPKNMYEGRDDQEKIILAVSTLQLGDHSVDVIKKIGFNPSYYKPIAHKPLNCEFGKYVMVYQFAKISDHNNQDAVDHDHVKKVVLYFTRGERLMNIKAWNLSQIKKRGYGCQPSSFSLGG